MDDEHTFMLQTEPFGSRQFRRCANRPVISAHVARRDIEETSVIGEKRDVDDARRGTIGTLDVLTVSTHGIVSEHGMELHWTPPRSA